MARAAPPPHAWQAWDGHTLSRAQAAGAGLLVRATSFAAGPQAGELQGPVAIPQGGAAEWLAVEADVGRFPEVKDLIAADDLPSLALLDGSGGLAGGPFPDSPAARAALSGGAGNLLEPRPAAEFLTVEGMAGGFLAQFDWKAYAVGRWARCPQPEVAHFLLIAGLRTGREEAVKAATLSLDALHKSDLNDPVDGGFFCSSRAAKWKDPITGKSLAMNAQLAAAFAVAGRGLGRTDFERVARDTARYINQFLTRADSALWWNGQAPDDDYYGRLQHRRSAGKRPPLESAMFADSCAQAISAMAAVALCCDEAEYGARAKVALEEIIDESGARDPPMFHVFEEGQWQGESFLRDLLALCQATLDVWCLTGDVRWFDSAGELAHGLPLIANEAALSLFERGQLAEVLFRLAAAKALPAYQIGAKAAMRVQPEVRYQSRAARAAWGHALMAQRQGVILIAGEPTHPLTRAALALSFAMGPTMLSTTQADPVTMSCGQHVSVAVNSPQEIRKALGEMAKVPHA